MTRQGCVYHIENFDTYELALAARQEAELSYNEGRSFEYIHCYASSPTYVDVEGDPVLFFWASQFTHVPDDVERNVRLGVLIQAIRDYLSSGQRPHPDKADAEQWIFSDEEGTGYTYQDITYLLQLNPDYLRGGLIKAAKSPRRTLRAIGRHLVRVTKTDGEY